MTAWGPEEAGSMAREPTRLAAAAGPLRAMPVRERARVLAYAAARWADSTFDPRRRLVPRLAGITGFSEAVIEAGLDRLFGTVTETALLDWWERRAGRDRPTAPGLIVVAATGNIPGVALFAAVAGLLAGAPVWVRPASAEPLLIPAWLDTLAETEPRVGAATRAQGWPRDDRETTALVFGAAGRILVFGRDETIAEMARRWPGRVCGYGTGLSLALVSGPEGEADIEVARRLALDVALWDQQGCLSPQGAYVLGDADRAAAFAGRLATALHEVAGTLPRGRITTAEAALIRGFRADIEARAAAGERVCLWSPGDGATAWTVALVSEPGFRTGPLNRTVWVRPLPDYADLPRHLAAVAPQLQAAGIQVPDADRGFAVAALHRAGVSFVTAVGTMQAPPVDWPNKGRDLLEDVLQSGSSA